MTAAPDIPADAGPGPRARTLAEAARERRDLVTGEVMAEERLIRFVAGPDGVVVPDVARKLPGRGMSGRRGPRLGGDCGPQGPVFPLRQGQAVGAG